MVIGPQHTGNSNYGFATYFLAITCLTLLFWSGTPTFTTYQFFCDLSQSLGLTDSFCITEFLSSRILHGGTGKCVYLGLSCRIYFKFLYFMGNMEIYKSCALQE
jgi:sec-independent protein translocase protein TatC